MVCLIYNLTILICRMVAKPSREEALKYFEDRKEEVYEALSKRTSQTNKADDREFPVISMLGTSSSVSGKTRNPSGILVQQRLALS